MKKSNLLFERLPFSKMGFLPFLLTFLFFASMQVDMKAQSSTLPSGNQIHPPARVIFKLPTGAFVSIETAKDRLLVAMTALKGQLAQYAEGTAPYDAAYLRYIYYTYILTNLNDGKSVPESIQHGAGMLSSDLSLGATPEQVVVERTAAIALLRP